MKPVDIVSEKTIDKRKEVNQGYIMTYLYDFINETNRIDNDCHLLLTTGLVTAAVTANSNE